jgi:asparagine synthase (glutamine-hydrolysing)
MAAEVPTSMCGICGLVNWGNVELLGRMNDLQQHRGPDDAGQWEYRSADGTYVGLASRRLAILDLSPAGHMPMVNDAGTMVITFNGEIYNYRELRQELQAKGYCFRSNTDTEVLLRLYEDVGPQCVRRLNGMFAFAIYDSRPDQRGRSGSPTIFLARDHFGIKPLYYIEKDHRLAFASEVKALLALPNFPVEMDMDALNQYMTFLWVPEPRTIYRGVHKLPAGHHAIWRDGRMHVEQYWDLSFPPAGTVERYTEAELTEELRARFRVAVQRQMISDVPIGAFLSAGLDSSSIVAMMAEAQTAAVRTYTIAFPSKYRVGESTLDDPGVARRVARHFGCDHQEIVVDPEVTQLLPRLIWHMDEPVADPAIIMAYLVAREARSTSTVLLSGIGGDELFAGYRKYYAYRWAQMYRRIPSVMRERVVEPAVLGLPALRGTPLKGPVRLAKKMMRSASLVPQSAFLMNSTYLDEREKDRLYLQDLRSSLNDADPWDTHRSHFQRVSHASFLHQMLYLDAKAFMVSLNLNYNDKMSMASSIEVRVPFLDLELAQFVASYVPPGLKLRGLLRPTTKYIFRKAMQGILPDEVLRQPKASFGAPLDYWLAGELRDMVDDLLSERRVRERGYFEPAAVRRLIGEHRANRHDWSMQIWQLLTLELWQQTFMDRSQPDSWITL